MGVHNYTYLGPYVEIVADKKFDIYDIESLIDILSEPLRETDHNNDVKLFTPNLRNTYSYNYGPNCDNGVTPLTAEDIERGMMEFRKEYAEHLLLLGEHVRSVHVRWGAISYQY